MKQHILILGATSAIARATAMAFAARGAELFLAGRDKTELERIAADLQIRYENNVHTGIFDIEDFSSHAGFLQKVIAIMPELNGIVFAIGYMGEPAQKVLTINFTGAVSILNLCTDYFIQQTERKNRFIIGISSVAGDRGRQSNYIYGAAKGGFSIYLQGLRNRLYRHDIRVITIKPGFVDTAMTFGLPGLFLVASPQKTGEAIAQSAERHTNIIYFPWFWRYIMLIINSIPESIFKRLTL